MIARIADLVTPQKRYGGLVCYVKNSEIVSLSLLRISIRKESLTTEEEITSFADLGKLKACPPSTRIGVSIQGDDVLFKKIVAGGASIQSAKDAARTAFPFLKPEEFYIQQYQTAGNIFVAVIRRETLNSIVQSLNAVGVIPYHISVGPFTFAQLLPWLPDTLDRFTLGGYDVMSSGSEITEIVQVPNKPDQVSLRPEAIQSALPLNLSIILEMLSPGRMSFDELGENLVGTLKNQHDYKTVYNAFRIGVAAVLFVLLAINVVYFQKYTRLNDALKEQHTSAILLKNKLEEVNGAYEIKKRFVDSLKLSSSRRISFYADRLAKSRPASIRWEALRIYPEIKKYNADNLRFDQGAVFVKGTCDSPVELQRWIGLLQEMTWIDAIAGQKYLFNEEKNIGEFEFSIQLKNTP